MRYTATLLLLLTCHAQNVHARPHTYSGYAARYRPGLMGKVSDNRGIPRENCMVAATFESIGTWVSVTGQRTGTTLRCKVVDVPAPRDRSHIQARGIIVEVAHKNALAICGSTRERPQDCPVIIRR